MAYLGTLRLSLLSLVLVLPGPGSLAGATAPPAAAPPDTAPAAAVKPPEPDAEKQAEAEKQAKAEAEKKKKAEAERQKQINTDKQRQTMADIRNLGTALFSWLTDQTDATVAEQEAESAAAGEPPPRSANEDTRKKTLDIQDNPLISLEDLEDNLVPNYIAAIPETDAWGNPYEIRLNTDNLMAKTVMSIRSPGRKGYYSGDVYKIEGFDPTDFDQDIVWADGFFVRWPSSPEIPPATKLPPSPPPGRK
jgi:hypothetical protein